MAEQEHPLTTIRFDGVRYEIVADTTPEEVEGVRIEHSSHKSREHGTYTRIGVTCPLSRSSHLDTRPCHRFRNVGRGQTTTFGAIEPVGHVGCWLARAEEFALREGHIGFKPTLSQVRDYLLARGFIRPARDT